MLIRDIGDKSSLQVKYINAFSHLLASKNIIFFISYRGGTTWLDNYNVTWPTACEAGYGGNLCHSCVHHDGTMYTRSNKHGNYLSI